MRPIYPIFSVISSFLSLFLPKRLKVFNVKATDNCRNPNYEQYCKEDQYFKKDGVQLGTLVAMKDFIGTSQDTFPQYSQPFMIVQGGCDKLIDPQVAFELFEKSKTP